MQMISFCPIGTTTNANRSIIGQAHVVLGLLAHALKTHNVKPTPPQKKARKESGPNWNNEEVLALVQAKRALHDEEDNCVDKHSLMLLDANKWLCNYP